MLRAPRLTGSFCRPRPAGGGLLGARAAHTLARRVDGAILSPNPEAATSTCDCRWAMSES